MRDSLLLKKNKKIFHIFGQFGHDLVWGQIQRFLMSGHFVVFRLCFALASICQLQKAEHNYIWVKITKIQKSIWYKKASPMFYLTPDALLIAIFLYNTFSAFYTIWKNLWNSTFTYGCTDRQTDRWTDRLTCPYYCTWKLKTNTVFSCDEQLRKLTKKDPHKTCTYSTKGNLVSTQIEHYADISVMQKENPCR